MGKRIVVAEDEADIRRLIVFMLRRRRYDVYEAAAGDAALTLIRTELPDLAILDVRMPDLTGLEVLAALARDPATAAIPVLILSAKGQAAEIEAGRRAGACAYVVKPFAPAALAAHVDALLADAVTPAGIRGNQGCREAAGERGT